MKPEIVERDTFNIIGIQKDHDAPNFVEALEQWQQLWDRNDEILAINPGCYYGLTMIPTRTRQSNNCQGVFRYMAAQEMADGATVPEGMTQQTLPPQKYAKYTYKGPISGFQAFIRRSAAGCLAWPDSPGRRGIGRWSIGRCSGRGEQSLMCLAVPGLVVEWLDRDPPFSTATVEFAGVRRRVSMECVPEAAVGDYVLVHAGIAISRIDAEEAAQVLETLRQLELDGEDEDEQT